MIYYIYREQVYKSLLPLNEKCIFENVPLVVAKMKSGTLKSGKDGKWQMYKFFLNFFSKFFFENQILFLKLFIFLNILSL